MGVEGSCVPISRWGLGTQSHEVVPGWAMPPPFPGLVHTSAELGEASRSAVSVAL